MAAEVIDSRYEIIEALPRTETDSSRIYKARDTAEERVVALKVISQSAVNAAGLTPAQYLTAFEAVKRLDHPNILRVYDHGRLEATGDLYIASEYLRGITLQERIRRVAPFSLAIAADISAAIAEALNYAHHQGIAHGDLNAGCIVLSPEGQIKVADFTGHTPPEEPGVSHDGHAAESAAGFSAAAMADLYALGSIIYRMLTGEAAIPAGDGLVSPIEFNPSVPQALNGVVQKAMHPSALQRYQTASSMLADLRVISDSLRAGRSLAWSPLGDKRAARPSGHPPAAKMPDAAVSHAQPEAVSAATDTVDDDQYGDEDRERPSAFGVILKIAFVIGILAVGFFSWKFTQFFAVPNDVVVPNLIGKTFDEAKGIAAHDHFTLTEAEAAYNPKWPENQIYRQDPVAGRSMKAGKDVVVYRSLGPKELAVPDLAGMTEERAKRALDETGLPAGKVTEEYSEAAEKGVVISQSPAKTTQVARNTPVDFVVSKGKEPPDIPTAVEATAIAPDKVEITWKPAAHAETYTVFRRLDGDIKTVSEGIKDTHFTDTDLKPETTYWYSVNAKNAISESDTTEPVFATTPQQLVSPPEIGPGVKVLPPASDGMNPGAQASPNAPGDTAPPRLRQFRIKFRVPRDLSGTHEVMLQVQDATGTTLAYDETREAGAAIDMPITAFGNRVVIRVILDGKLIKQETK